MKLRKGVSYTTKITHLAIKILSTAYVGSNTIKFKGLLYNKRNGIIYEQKNYKLPKNIPEFVGWEIHNE